MNRNGPPCLADWVGLTVRWIFIIAVSFYLSFNNKINWLGILLLFVGVAGNIVSTVLMITNRLSGTIRFISIAADLVYSMLLFSLVLFSGWQIIWIGLLPVITAALYLRWIGMISAILVSGFTQIGLMVLLAPQQKPLWLILIVFFLYAIFGVGATYVGARLKPRLKDARGVAVKKDMLQRRTIFELISQLSATLNYEKILETSLDLGVSALAQLGALTDQLVSAVLVYAEKNTKAPELAIITSRRMMPSDKTVKLPGTDGVLAVAIENGDATFVKTPFVDPELSRINSLRGCQSAFILPLRSGLDAYGVLLFAHADEKFFTPERREVLEIIRNQSTIAIQNARLYQALDEEKNRMMEIQEESRKKLARDLHDGPTQSISAIAMRVNFARRLMDRDVKAASEELFKIEDLARRTTKEIRHMLFTLRPLVLESQGLIAALQSMADKMKETYGQDVVIQVDPRLAEMMEPSKGGVVFFIAEEAVNNARKHASAPQIWVRFRLVRDGISLLEIEDNGVGFDVNSVENSYENRGSLGMINLRERTELVNGILRINSVKGHGTCVQVVIPLTEEAADLLRRGG
jgi:signal transduction histidine kinase